MLSTSASGRIYSGSCPTDDCKAVIIYSDFVKDAQCWQCKLKFPITSLTDACEIRDSREALVAFWKLLTESSPSLPEPPVAKVLGLSTYHCKLLSPLLTRYGIDKTGKAKTIQELKNCATFDCSWLGDRSFSIEPDKISVPGYGQDNSGSVGYLAGTLSLLRSYNNDRDALVPLHVDGDGHCLVHAVSRAIVGRELFWHALRTGLKLHLEENLPKYKELLSDFINTSEWADIIAECDPDYSPCDNEMLGLRNVHVFGLANVLRRPILLIDSVAGMQSSGDYSALFLPGLIPPDQCRDRNGELNKPICLAWSSSGRNHYIPLVGIKGSELPMFPRSLLPKVWGVCHIAVEDYIEFNEHNCLVIGGGKMMQDTYLLKLASGMNTLFRQKHGVDVSLVADTYYCNFKKGAAFDMKPSEILSSTKAALQERRLVRCLNCTSVNLLPLSTEWLRPHGLLYNIAKKQSNGGVLRDQHMYTFHNYGVTCIYNARKDILVVETSTNLEKCSWCESDKLRLIHSDGNIVYENGDKTTSVVDSPIARCKCGFKHWYNGREYDNPPLKKQINFEWKSKMVVDEVLWFQDETDPLLNSDPNQIASFIIHRHLPGERDSAKVRQMILEALQAKAEGSVPSATQTRPENNSSPSQSQPHVVDNSALSQDKRKAFINNSPIEKTIHTSQPVLKTKDSSAFSTPKKRHSDGHGGALPKQRSTPASLAAAAAMSRAAANQGQPQSKRKQNDCPVPTPMAEKNEEHHRQQTIRLGPGYSVISDPDSDEIIRGQNLNLLQEVVKATELMTDYFASFADSETYNSHNTAKVSPSSSNSKSVSHWGDKHKKSNPGYGSLSRVANLLNVGGDRDLSDDCMTNSEEEDML